MDVAEGTENVDDSAPVRQKRSRNGCLTCRTRRRKCDESRPICQNCTSKKLECRYAAAFQILGKHNFTPEVDQDVKYGTVRFVGDDKNRAEKSHAGDDVQREDKAGKDNSTSSVVHVSAEPGHDVASHTPSPNSYEFALHGLLALGSGTASNDASASSSTTLPQTDPLTLDTRGSHDTTVARDTSASQAMTTAQDQLQWLQFQSSQSKDGPYNINSPAYTTGTASTDRVVPFFGNRNITSSHQPIVPYSPEVWRQTSGSYDPSGLEDNALKLLKYYRYSIAPWLDICDSNHCFGVEVLGLSVESPAVRNSILSLADASLKRSWNIQPELRDFGEDEVITEALVRTFGLLESVATDLTKYWNQEENEGYGRHILEKLLPQLAGASSLAYSTYWLVVRLVLSCALVATTPIRIPLPFIASNLFRSADNNSIARCAQDAIALCVDAVMFSQGDEDGWLQQRYALNRVGMWKALIQGFAHWYMNRPQEYQPIIELYPKDGVQTDDDLPVVVFTDGAALLANQLYHTGMLLLLQHKPRFAEKPSSNSTSMSPLWHAHRICGIAMQNDGAECWDPCLAASLIVAARTITHSSQHSAILFTLQNLQRLTGWTISTYIDELKNEWQLAGGW